MYIKSKMREKRKRCDEIVDDVQRSMTWGPEVDVAKEAP